ncbi:hypothetical protein BD309DRAFT_67350 [Dichomitus squalens]|nr:hypothetical protein BD309DRAFT_67350 [Dichomitus squalens]
MLSTSLVSLLYLHRLPVMSFPTAVISLLCHCTIMHGLFSVWLCFQGVLFAKQ